jgi:hypothetical protein
MKKTLFFLLLWVVTCPFVIGQGLGPRFIGEYGNVQQFMNDANGRPLSVKRGYTIEGSPFFSEEYCTAKMKVRNGKKYSGIKVKINLLENTLIYDAADGQEMVAISPIERVDFINCGDSTKNKTLMTGFPAIDGQNESSFYLLLDSGKISLLKYIKVNYRDTKNYGSNNIVRVFERKEIYYTYRPDKGMLKLDKDTNAILSALDNKKPEISGFISKNDLKCRREEDLVKVFSYYNSLNP